MVKYRMKFFGSVDGKVSGLTKHFDKDQIVEAPEGEFDEATADLVSEDQELEKLIEEEEKQKKKDGKKK
jgi:hypothetical protein